MKTDGTHIDINSATIDRLGYAKVGWRRRIQVRKNLVSISELASPDRAGIEIGAPEPEIIIFCEPKLPTADPIIWSGWLALEMLEPGHNYWLELRAYGYTSIEREDGAPHCVWHWQIKPGTWGGTL